MALPARPGQSGDSHLGGRLVTFPRPLVGPVSTNKTEPPLSDLAALTATEQARLVRERTVSPVELVDAALSRIETVQPVCGPFAFVFAEEARKEATRLARSPLRGSIPPLLGVPVAFKDFTPTQGHRTTRGSFAFENWVADYDPVIVRRFKQAGAIVIGKTTTPEFAHSSFTRSPLWGMTGNPWDPARSAGGSSGGSGVAVTTGCAALAEGTDMGGSVRIPAALCGCVGLKPSLGRIPMDILPTVFDDMSHFGPLTRTVQDASLFLSVAEGPDDTDISSQRRPVPLPDRLDGDLTGIHIALSEDLGMYEVNPEVRKNLLLTADALRDAGATIEPVELGWSAEIYRTWMDWWGVYLAAIFADCLADHRERMDPKVVALIEAGLAKDAVSFARIDQVRTRQWYELARVFERFHALICPTMALPAPDNSADEDSFEFIDDSGRVHGLDMTSPFNMVAQCPALSVPSGVTSDGLPTAIQIVGRRFDDPMVLKIGTAVEKRRPWCLWTPELLPSGPVAANGTGLNPNPSPGKCKSVTNP
ncbi:MAG: amidase [Paracoccaceae bacterium]|nr:amidase [Paracoccaceae bacterium]